MKYIIKDWAGNDLTPFYGEFNTAEDAWAALYLRFDHLSEKQFNEQMDEFVVDTKGK